MKPKNSGPLHLDIFIDHAAREIMYLVASVHLSVRLCYGHHCLSELSCLNRFTYYCSEGFVCVSVIRKAYTDDLTDAVNQLSISSAPGQNSSA